MNKLFAILVLSGLCAVSGAAFAADADSCQSMFKRSTAARLCTFTGVEFHPSRNACTGDVACPGAVERRVDVRPVYLSELSYCQESGVVFGRCLDCAGRFAQSEAARLCTFTSIKADPQREHCSGVVSCPGGASRVVGLDAGDLHRLHYCPKFDRSAGIVLHPCRSCAEALAASPAARTCTFTDVVEHRGHTRCSARVTCLGGATRALVRKPLHRLARLKHCPSVSANSGIVFRPCVR